MLLQSLFINDIKIIIVRDDLEHATVSGNKLHKLTPNIELAKNRNCSTILSFGGPYSNHLHALAWACKENQIESIGIVRGELHQNLTPTLRDCKEWGMRLYPCSRKDYRAYQEELALLDTPVLLGHDSLIDNESMARLTQALPHSAKGILVIPEGGSNVIAIESLASTYRNVFNLDQCKDVTHAMCATGTGATVAGLSLAAPDHVKIIGVQAVSEGSATLERIQSWLGQTPNNLTIVEGHLGGFAKTSPALLESIDEFEAAHNVPLDPIYNGKVIFKVSRMIAEGKFKPSDVILLIHTGGLQGKR